MKTTGALIIISVLLYVWFVGPDKDKWGRYTTQAYMTCIFLVACLIGGFVLLITPTP